MPLVRRRVVARTEEERTIEAVGGEYEAVSPIGLEAEVRKLGVRALGLVNSSLLSSVAGLEQIEFLSAGFGRADPALSGDPTGQMPIVERAYQTVVTFAQRMATDYVAGPALPTKMAFPWGTSLGYRIAGLIIIVAIVVDAAMTGGGQKAPLSPPAPTPPGPTPPAPAPPLPTGAG
jgi:hypothetical protein